MTAYKPFSCDLDPRLSKSIDACGEVLNHAADHSLDGKIWRQVFRQFGIAKGLPERVDDVAVCKFFYDT